MFGIVKIFKNIFEKPLMLTQAAFMCLKYSKSSNNVKYY